MPKRRLIIINLGFFVLGLGLIFGALNFFLLPTHPLVSAILALNGTAFLLMGLDKANASYQGETRIPELFFYGIGLLGGVAGVVAGAVFFRHKTKKPQFLGWVGLILLLQMGLLFYWLNWRRSG